MRRILRTATSRADLVDIYRWLRARTTQGARNVYDEVNQTIELLAVHPGIGSSRDDLARGLRFFPVSRFPHYLVFYQPLRDGLLVVRVLHGARDVKREFRGA